MPAGSMTRALNAIKAMQQKLAACCCCGRRRHAADQDLQSALWKGPPSPGSGPGAGEDDAPPLLEEAAAQQAAAAMSAAMLKKLAAAEAAAGGPAASAKAAPPGTGSVPAEPCAAAPSDGLIGAAVQPEAPDAGREQLAAPEEPHTFSHVDSMVRYFERLSPVKVPEPPAPADSSTPELPDALDGLSQAAAADAAAGGSPADASERRPLPRRTESRRAFLKQLSRHARFEGVPEAREGDSTASPTAASDSPMGSSSAATPSAALLTGKTPGSAATSGKPPTSRLASSGRMGSGHSGMDSSDQQLAAELREDGGSEFSANSGTSSREAGGSRAAGLPVTMSFWCHLWVRQRS